MSVARMDRCFLRYWFLWVMLVLPIDLAAQTGERLAHITVKSVRIPVGDGLKLHGFMYYPVAAKPAPIIVLLNPWSIGGEIYAIKAREWAKRGFVVLTYNLRGWAGSEGEADVGGSRDMGDVSQVIDWLESDPRVDPKAIGFGGVSLGAGVALLAAASEPRIRAVAAMSGWADLYSPIYGYNTQRTYWNVLLLLGSLMGTGSSAASHDREIREAIAAGNLPGIHAYADLRSPLVFMDQYARNKTAVFLSHNYSDILFPVSDMWKFFSALDTNKKLMLQNGVHASTEVFGMLGHPNQVWDGAEEWFERWLKPGAPVATQSKSELEIHLADKVLQAPKGADLIHSTPRFYLQNSSQQKAFGKLAMEAPLTGYEHPIAFGKWSGINSGFPLVYPLIPQGGVLQPAMKISRINPWQTAVYEGAEASEDFDVIGIPRISLMLRAEGQEAQVVVYLFQVTPDERWNLISMTPYSMLRFQAGQSQNVEFELYGAFASFHKGDRLVLAIDTYDPEFSSPGHGDFSVDIETTGESWIELPMH